MNTQLLKPDLISVPVPLINIIHIAIPKKSEKAHNYARRMLIK